MGRNRPASDTVSRLTVHIVWVTKYRSHVLKGEIHKRWRVLLVQICDAEDVRIVKGVVSKDHVPMLLEYPPSLAVSDLVKRLKGRRSRLLQQEVPEVQKRSWGNHVWAVGSGAWRSGTITDELVAEYLEHHRDPSNHETDPLILD